MHTLTGPNSVHTEKIHKKTLSLYSGLILRLRGLLISEAFPHQAAKTERGGCLFKYPVSTNHKVYKAIGKCDVFRRTK